MFTYSNDSVCIYNHDWTGGGAHWINNFHGNVHFSFEPTQYANVFKLSYEYTVYTICYL